MDQVIIRVEHLTVGYGGDANSKFVTSYFDGNSEAYNKLRVGGAK